ncbi:hypothetical protein GCM10029963_21400 [Micromonospora andamanensis]
MVSWRQTTSGAVPASQSSSRGSRAFTEFTFHVARRMLSSLPHPGRLRAHRHAVAAHGGRRQIRVAPPPTARHK